MAQDPLHDGRVLDGGEDVDGVLLEVSVAERRPSMLPQCVEIDRLRRTRSEAPRPCDGVDLPHSVQGRFRRSRQQARCRASLHSR